MTQVVDTSAILALLFGEPGRDAASEALETGIVSAVNLAEAASVLARHGKTPDEIEAALDAVAKRSIAADRHLALDAGALHAVTRAAGLSFGDRFCLALAQRLRAPAVTADRAWLRIADTVGVEVRLIR